MDPLFCAGDDNGRQCRCHRFIQHEHSKCTCGHPEGYHPEPKAITTVTATPATSTAATIVAAYQVPSTFLKKPISQAVASSSRLNDVSASKAAVDETNAGLKKKRKIPDNASVSDPKRRRSSKEKEKIVMGQLIMIVTKGVKRGTSKQWTTPKDGEIANMEHVGLAANGLRCSWAFNLDWDATEMDVWFREALPNFFAYMDSNHPLNLVQPFHYRLMIRSNSTLSLSPQLSCDGKEFRRYLGNNGKTDARKIYLLANHHIPASTYENGWQIAPVVENAPESDSYDTMEEESDTNDWELVSDEDETQQIRRKSIARGKRPSRVLSPTRSLISIADEDSEDDLPASIIPALYSSSIPSTAIATPTPLSFTTNTGPVPTPAAPLAAPMVTATTIQPASGPSSSRASRFTGSYSTYSTFNSKPFVAWDSSDFEIDPFFWTRAATPEDGAQ
ncbi:hypothetical protein C8R46DRAFT_1060087 [Mycena filopes]|nr:hypothetical protein C8R46DRAFT_1060087 [Mycena filopes]